MQALTAHDAGGTTACLLARVQLARGGAATTAWHLLSACLPAAFQAEPETVAAVVTRMFEQGEYKQVRALLGMQMPGGPTVRRRANKRAESGHTT